MKPFAMQRLPLIAISAASLLCLQTPSYGFLNIFGKKDRVAPGTAERQSQEAEANALLIQARDAQNSGRTGRASDLYKHIKKKFPFTNAAAEAAYSQALIIRQNGRLDDAFDAFQEFIQQYRQSARFDDAVRQQFELAEEAKGGRRQASIILIPVKMGPDEIVDLYKKVIANAPYGKLAPLSQFSIAEVYQDAGEKSKAVAAYQAVVDNYPSSSKAGEAQFRIGSISSVAATRSEDQSNLVASRDALTSYVERNPKGERSSEAQAILNQVNTAEAQQSLEVGKFYERTGKAKAAAIYYNEALKYGSPEASAEARERLGKLAAAEPEAVSAAKRGQPDQDYTVPGTVNLRKRPDYVGPIAPELAKLSQKSKMRTGGDDFMPIPVQEPTLPTKPGAAPSAGAILPPVPEEKPGLLPIPPPPAPVAPTAPLPVPPPPTGAKPAP